MTNALIIAFLVAITAFCLKPRPDLPPKQVAQSVPYCVISYPAAGKDQSGKWHKGWAYGYGPCSQLDRYENI